jgi:hypothetical protein
MVETSAVLAATLGLAAVAWFFRRPRQLTYLTFFLLPTSGVFYPVSTFFLSPIDALIVVAAGILLVRVLSVHRETLAALAINRVPWLLVAWFALGDVVLSQAVPATLVRLAAYIAFSSFVVSSLKSEEDLRRAAWMLALAGLWVFLLGILFVVFDISLGVWAYFIDPSVLLGSGGTTRFGPFGPNYSGLWMMIGLSVILSVQRTWKWRLVAACMTGGILATMSRTTWVGLACVALFIPRFNRKVLPAYLAVAAFCIGGAGFMGEFGDRLFERVRAVLENDDRSVFLHRRFTEMAIEAVQDDPLFGIGFGNFPEYALRRQPDIALDLIPSAMQPHSIYAQLLACGGLAALGLFLAHLRELWPLRHLRDAHRAFVLPLGTILIVGLGQDLLVDAGLWSLLGLALAARKVLATPARPS